MWYREKQFEDLPHFESTSKRRQYGWDCKRVEEPEFPIKKFLLSNVGEDWGRVYSELKLREKEIILPQYSFDEVINWHVEKVIGYNDNGELLCKRGTPLSNNDFYVDNNNILQRYVAPKFKRKKEKKIWHIVVDGKDYAERNGLWYKLTMKPLPPEKWVQELRTYHVSPNGREYKMWQSVNKSESRYDVFFGQDIRAGGMRSKLWDRPVYCDKYSSCNTKDMKIIKEFLKNV